MNKSVGTLTVNLKAIAKNWQLLGARIGDSVECGAVVKANAYGLGVEPVTKVLFNEGCRTFFVANVIEALELRGVLSDACDGSKVNIFVFTGCAPGDEALFVEHRLCPVIVSVDMLERWVAVCAGEKIEEIPKACVKNKYRNDSPGY